MLRIHSETVCLLALAAASITLVSSGVKRTGTILPLASPLGSFGRPGFLGFFGCAKTSKLLYDCRPYRLLWRCNWPEMQDCHMSIGSLWIIRFVCPCVGSAGLGVIVKIE